MKVCRIELFESDGTFQKILPVLTLMNSNFGHWPLTMCEKGSEST